MYAFECIERCPVLKAESPEIQRSRTALCSLTAGMSYTYFPHIRLISALHFRLIFPLFCSYLCYRYTEIVALTTRYRYC